MPIPFYYESQARVRRSDNRSNCAMKKTARFLLFVLCCSVFSLAGQNTSPGIVYVSGRGENRENAVLDALMQAVTKKNRIYLASESNVHNDKISEKQSRHSFGRISKFYIVETDRGKGFVQVQLAVIFDSEETSAGQNRLSNQEIWNLAQQLKYFNAALAQIKEIFLNNPFRVDLRKYSFKTVQDNERELLFLQDLRVSIERNLYNAQMSRLSSLLEIYCKEKRTYSYGKFKQNSQKILNWDPNQSKVCIADVNLTKVTEYLVPDQFFHCIRESLNYSNVFFTASFYNAKSKNISNRGASLGDMRYFYQEHNKAMVILPLFCPGTRLGKNRFTDRHYEFKYHVNEARAHAECTVRYHFGKNRGTDLAVIRDTGKNSVQTVTATGIGATPEAAEKDALKEALATVCGNAVISKTLIKNDNAEFENIISKTNGIIQKYRVVKNERKYGAHACTIEAVVNENKLIMVNRRIRSYTIDFSPIVGAVDKNILQNASQEKAGKLLAKGVRRWIYQSLSSRLTGKFEMGPQSRISGNHVSGLPCKIRVSAKISRYQEMLEALTPIIKINALDSHKVYLNGMKNNIDPILQKYKYMPAYDTRQHLPDRRNKFRQIDWNFAIVYFDKQWKPDSIVFYSMPKRFMDSFKKHVTKNRGITGNSFLPRYFANSHIYLFVDFFNKQNKRVCHRTITIGGNLPIKDFYTNLSTNRYVWSPYIYNGKNFIDIDFTIDVNLQDLKGDNLECISEIVYGYNEPRFDDFSKSDVECFRYNECINRKSRLYGHEWYYLQCVLRQRGTLLEPESEYAVYYSHVVDNKPLGKSWENGGLGFVPEIRATRKGAFKVAAMSPYSSILQGDKVYSFNGKTFTDVKDLFKWLKKLPAGEKIVLKTDNGDKTIILPPRKMAEDYWKKQHPAGQPLTPRYPKNTYTGFVDQEARQLFSQKKYYHAWLTAKSKNPCDVELIGELARVLYYTGYTPPQKEAQPDVGKKMTSLDDFNNRNENENLPETVALFAKEKGSAVGAYFSALHWYNNHKNRQFISRDYVNSTLFKSMLDASRMGSDDADNYLGYMLVNGQGCQQHYNAALSYFKKAAVKFHSSAEYNIGRFYLYGWGRFTMKVNRFKANYWLKRSVEHGSKDAQELLKKLDDEAREYFRRR